MSEGGDNFDERLRCLEKDVAVMTRDVANIKDTLKDFSINYKVLNEHHIDTQNDLGILKAQLSTLKGTIFAGFTIMGAVVGIVVFVVEYVLK